LLDLEARECGAPLAARLASHAGLTSNPLKPVRVSALLASASLDELASEAEQAVASGFTTLKLKVGASSLERDRTRLRALRASVDGEVRIRIDANEAWGAAEALRAIDSLAEFDLEFVEQPVAGADLAGLAQVAASSPVPVAADEACADRDSALTLIDRALCPVLVLKPALVGGPQAAMALATRAQAQGLQVVLTTLLDSAIGRAMALHVAAALPSPPAKRGAWAHGLATAPLLADDLCEAESFERGTLRVAPAAGLGITPEPARLARCASGETKRFGTAAA
jgi:L-alanine-DL-glutamate epimerase-like enolase superfamily enzyme